MESIHRLLFAFSACVLLTSVASIAIKPRIIGGYDVPSFPYHFGYQVSMRQNGTHYCSGAILSDRWIITAYECVKGVNLRYVDIAYGARRLSEDSKTTKIAKVFKHPHLSDTNLENNMAMLMTLSKITFETAEPIAITIKPAVEGDVAIVSGWGDTDPNILENHHFSDMLQSQITTVMSTERCRALSGKLAPLVHNTTLCTKNPVGAGICTGDLGSPLVSKTKLKTLIGIALWHGGCAEGNPDGYTAIFPSIQWIRSLLRYSPLLN